MVKSTSGPFESAAPRELERRAELTHTPLELSADDLDPNLGTVTWTRFSSLVETEAKSTVGALLIVDLDDRSRALAEELDENRIEVLPLLVGAIRQAIRQDDLLTHIDACRFAVLLLGAPQDVAADVADRILESVDNTVFFIQQSIAPLSVNIGGATFGRHTPGKSDPVRLAAENLALSQKTDRRIQIA